MLLYAELQFTQSYTESSCLYYQVNPVNYALTTYNKHILVDIRFVIINTANIQIH